MTTVASDAITKTNKYPLVGVMIAQFFGAFNDNAWKLIVFTLATRALTVGVENFESSSQYQATLGFLLFLFPMLIFSLPAGVLADYYSKRSMIVTTKAMEVVLMGLATYSLWFFPENIAFSYTVLALMGAQSAFFGPAKYGILPEILPNEKLSKGNGLLEMWSMIAIIAGTGLGPIFLAFDKEGLLPNMTWVAPLWLFSLSCIGFLASLYTPYIPPQRATNLNLYHSVKKSWRSINKDNILFLAVVGGAFYWFVISLLGQHILIYAKAMVQELQKGEIWQGIPPASYGIGIALGALIAGRLSGDKIEYGLIPLGAAGFAATSITLGFLQPAMTGTVIILILMGISSGTVIVPLHALVQSRAPKKRLGAIIAFANVLDIFAMILGSLTASAMAWLGMHMGLMLLSSAMMVLATTIWAIRLLPDALIRLFFILLTITFYRIRVLGAENIPKKGPALLASNHLSIIDALFIMATVDRPVRFVIADHYYNKWWIKPIAKIMGTIPIRTFGGESETLSALRRASELLENGHLVCIFPEGQVSLNGMLLPFRRGVEVMMEGRKCPIIPIHIDLIGGHLFTFDDGRYFPKLFEQFPSPMTVSFGEALAPQTPVYNIRQAIQELSSNAWSRRKEYQDLIHRQFIRQVRWKPWRTLVADQTTGALSRFKSLIASLCLARALKKIWKDEQHVAVLVPPSVGAVLTNIAATISGKTVVNLNFTAGTSGMRSAIEQAAIETIITSKQFLEKASITLPEGPKVVLLEDLKKTISTKMRLSSMVLALFAPIRLIERICGNIVKPDLDDPLTIIFTSGSTGEPKGVVLSHFNVVSNTDAIAQVIPPLSKQDKFLAALPLFHGFGYMQMWLGVNHNFDLILHPNPLDAVSIGALVKKYKASIMLTTPTFLNLYLQKVTPDQFAHLQCVLTGAEKLSQKLAQEFENKFGIRPIEGYGASECSPVISTSVPNIRKKGKFQAGSQPGTIGQPLPGVIIKIVNPDTFEEVPFGIPGLLLVKGPNVMQGYLHRTDLTRQAIKDDWYCTGDIVSLDEDGFLKITDRLSRFSKIGGEMVPHGTIEDALHQAIDSEDKIFAVTAIPDKSKGEKLIVLHTLAKDKIPDILKQLASFGLPNLFIPRQNHFIKVDAIPILGTGKVDFHTVKQVAQAKFSS